jgi:mRNA interferase MazF
LGSVIVVPLTTSSRARKGPTSVLLASGSNGLSEDSFVLCHQITTLDRSKLTEKIGRVSLSEQARIDRGVLAAVDLL